MMHYVLAFIAVLLAIIVTLGIAHVLVTGRRNIPYIEGSATASMCTTKLLEHHTYEKEVATEDFVVEQDLVYTFDSLNLDL